MLFALAVASATNAGAPRLFTPGALPSGYVLDSQQGGSVPAAAARPVVPLPSQPRVAAPLAVAPAATGLLALYQLNTVQKTLELVVMTAIGVWARTKLTASDANVIQKFLLVTITPCVIFTALCKIKVGLDSLSLVFGGVALVVLQQVVAHIAAYTVFGRNTSKMNEKTQDLRRTAVTEMATMAPAASAFAFVTEFVGPIYVGLAALLDLAMKAYVLIFMRYVLKAKSSGTVETSSSASGASGKSSNLGKKIWDQVTDPFNASILAGVVCSIIYKGTAVAKLGFAGLALETMAAAQTPVLFLLIGLKVSIDGATPSLCGVLLLLRHGLLMLFVKAFLLVSGIASLQMQLLIVLASQAANAMIGLAQINAAKDRGVKGYDTDFAFDIICISYPMTIMLNTVACVGGSAFIANMFPIAGVLIGLSGVLYAVSKDKINEALGGDGTELAAQ
jgi:hypothetical protein